MPDPSSAASLISFLILILVNKVITAVEVTPDAVYEAHKMTSLIDDHTTNTLIKPDTV